MERLTEGFSEGEHYYKLMKIFERKLNDYKFEFSIDYPLVFGQIMLKNWNSILTMNDIHGTVRYHKPERAYEYSMYRSTKSNSISKKRGSVFSIESKTVDSNQTAKPFRVIDPIGPIPQEEFCIQKFLNGLARPDRISSEVMSGFGIDQIVDGQLYSYSIYKEFKASEKVGNKNDMETLKIRFRVFYRKCLEFESCYIYSVEKILVDIHNPKLVIYSQIDIVEHGMIIKIIRILSLKSKQLMEMELRYLFNQNVVTQSPRNFLRSVNKYFNLNENSSKNRLIINV